MGKKEDFKVGDIVCWQEAPTYVGIGRIDGLCKTQARIFPKNIYLDEPGQVVIWRSYKKLKIMK